MTRDLAGAIIAVLMAGPVSAQWLNLPTPGIPRTPEGKPNLAAPAPRAANGKPDLSGIWELEHPPCPADGCSDYIGGPEFLNLGVKLKGGLPYQPWAAELVQQRSADLGRDDPVARCLPAGAVRILTFPPPRKIIQTPGEIVILSERCHFPADLHRWPSDACRSLALVERILDRQMGRGHVGSGNQRIAGWGLAGPER